MKIKKLSIFASFISLWLTSYLSDNQQLFVGFVLILTFGIIHGANDLLILKKLYEENKVNSLQGILIKYLLFILITTVLFYFTPLIALMLFIITSGYHFGEQQWSNLFNGNNNLLVKFFQTIYGLVILFLVFYFNKSDVIKIVKSISNYKIPEYTINYLLLFLLLIFLFLFYYFFKKNEALKIFFIEEIINFFVIIILFKVSSLIWGFTIYFVIWHSLPSLNDQVLYLYGKNDTLSFIKYFKNALIYWLVALFGLYVFYFFTQESKLFEAILFSFIAAITFPHALVMNRMFKT